MYIFQKKINETILNSNTCDGLLAHEGENSKEIVPFPQCIGSTQLGWALEEAVAAGPKAGLQPVQPREGFKEDCLPCLMSQTLAFW